MRNYIISLFLLLAAGTDCAAETVKAVLFPFREVIIASRIDSRTGKYNFRQGEAFSAGTVLTELESESYAIKLKQAQNQLEFSRAVYEDKKQLRKENFTSDFELKKSEYEYRMAESSLAIAQLNLSYCKVKAPFPGKIVEIITREYETVRPGQKLFRIIDDNCLLAVMNLPLKNVQPVGSVMTIKIQNGVRVQGKIYEISPQADHRTGTVRIRVLIDNRQGKLRAGMTGELIHDK